MFYFYVLENDLGQLYFGKTSNLKRRLQEHQDQKSRATKGSKWHLIYYESYRTEADALEREYMVKNNGGTKAALKKRIRRSRQFES